MVEDAISFWTDIQRYENMLAADSRSYCFVPLSELYRKLGLLDDAISVAAKGCSVHPDYAGGFYALGAAYSAKGQKAEAKTALERAVALKADHVEAMKLLGQLYVEEGRMDLAEQVLREVLEQQPDDTETTLLLHSITAEEAAQPIRAGQAGEAGEAEEPEELEPEPEEVLLEEADVIEDLTEVFDEPLPLEVAAPQPAEERMDAVAAFLQAEEETEAATVAAPSLTAAGAATQVFGAPEKAEEEPFGFGESADFWAIGTTEESVPAEPYNPFEENGGFRAFEDIEELEGAEAENLAAVTEPAAPPFGKDPLSTATLAELYVSQGFVDKALRVYQDLVAAHPANEAYRKRLAELQGGAQQGLPEPVQGFEVAAQAQEEVYGQGDAVDDLSLWLENIRRRRDGV